jgi:hypothetical protein
MRYSIIKRADRQKTQNTSQKYFNRKKALAFAFLISLLFLSTIAVVHAETYTFSFKWGSFGYDQGQFYGPTGIDLDTSGNVYVADPGNYRIQKFTSEGIFLTSWGGNFMPRDVALDVYGNVYVADTLNSQIQKFTTDGTFITTIGSKGTGDGQIAAGGPWGVAVDVLGNVYVADSYGGRVEKFGSDGTFLASYGPFNNPRGVGVDDNGNIYVANTRDNCIVKLDRNGVRLATWGSWGHNIDGLFSWPGHVDIDAVGNVYVADTENHCIQKFTSEGYFLARFGGSPDWFNPGTGDGQLASPYGVAVNAAGNVYAVDCSHSRIQVFSLVPEFPLPEYNYGALAAIAICFVAFFVVKKPWIKLSHK